MAPLSLPIRRSPGAEPGRADSPRTEPGRADSRRTAAPAGLALLFLAAVVTACDVESGDRAADAPGDTAGVAAAADTALIRVDDAGLRTPESMLYDDRENVYLVSNINGAPLGRDGNGFISRVGPDGTVRDLRWIDGAADGVTLHAPKGLALSGDTLFVADIDSVRAFSRTSGEPWGARGVPGAAFLNDLAVGPDGTLYVSDTGVDASFESTGADAIYRFGPSGVTAVARGPDLAAPNGITVADGALLVVSFGSADVRRIQIGGQAGAEAGAGQVVATLPGGQLDGVIRMDDGSLLVSSWESSAVFRVHLNGEAHVETVVEGVTSPADIGYDPARRRLLIPVFMEDRLEFRSVR